MPKGGYSEGRDIFVLDHAFIVQDVNWLGSHVTLFICQKQKQGCRLAGVFLVGTG